MRLGEADVAFVFSSRRSSTLPPSEYKQIPICREQIVFFANPYARLACKKGLCLADLAEANLILTNKDGIYSEWLTQLCKRAGLRISPCQYIDSGSLLKQFVMKHDCVLLISKRVIEQELLNGTLVELPLMRRLIRQAKCSMYKNLGSCHYNRSPLSHGLAQNRSIGQI